MSAIIWLRRWEQLLDRAPLLLAINIAVLGFASLVCLLLDRFSLAPVLVVALPAMLLLSLRIWRIADTTASVVGGDRIERIVVDTVVAAGLVGWVFFNLFFTFEHVYTNRDPATYAVAGGWLSQHDSLRIPKQAEYTDIEGVVGGSAGFATNPDDPSVIHAQGQHLLPALLGVAGKIVGPQQMLRLNILFGAVAIFTIYGVSRIFARPFWASLAAGALALSLPVLYFSRDTYSEPLAAIFTAASFTLLWLAFKQKHSLVLWLLSGFMIGMSTTARIDGYLLLVLSIVFGALYLVQAKKKNRIHRVRHLSVHLLGFALAAIIGVLDVYLLSRHYYIDISPRFYLQLMGLASIGLVAGVGVLLGWHTNILNNLYSALRSRLAIWGAGLLAVFFVVLASRPLWLESMVPRRLRNAEGVLENSGTFYRDYAEFASLWNWWYLGVVIGFAGVVGMILFLYRAIKTENIVRLSIAFAVLASMALYFVRPSIFPDQIWASRRQLPIIYPGIIIFASYALSAFHAHALKYLQSVPRAIGITMLMLVILASPVLASRQSLFVKETKQLGSVYEVCDKLPDNPAVLLVGIAHKEMQMPLRVYCGDTHVAGVATLPEGEKVQNVTLKGFAEQAHELGKEPVVVFYTYDAHKLIDDFDQVRDEYEIVLNQFNELERTNGIPSQIIDQRVEIVIGAISLDGQVKPL